MSAADDNNNSNNNMKMKKKSSSGVDALLTAHGKNLDVGQGLSIRLIKGPSITENPDPVDPKAPSQQFPILAKFPVSVVKPDFSNTASNNNKKRLYQQDVPKAVDDSEEEGGEEGADGGEINQPKKRWKSRRKEIPQRQWILQDEVEFLETMLARRERQAQDGTAASGSGGGGSSSSSSSKNKKLSTRYEGEPEQNTSHYMILRVPRDDDIVSNHEDLLQDGRCLQACLVPTNAMVAFAQPDARKTFTLSQAERVIEDQRHGVQTLHHLHDEGRGDNGNGSGEPQTLQQLLGRRRGKGGNQKPFDAKSRLLQKFEKIEASKNPSAEVDDGDDVMADVAYRNRKGAGTARKELLETVSNVKVSDEGVLGGANDALFGGRQRFGQYKSDDTNSNNNNANNKRGMEESSTQERGADGAAMADDFYSRDVEAEYKAMDFDANELFDDDSVDHGEKDVDEDNDGMANLDDDDEDDDDESDDEDDGAIGGAAGLASAQGFKKLLEEAVRGKMAAANEDAQQPNGASGTDKGGVAANGQQTGKKNMDKNGDRNSHQSKLASILTGGRSTKTTHGETRPMDVDTPTSTPSSVAAPRRMDTADVGSNIGPDGLRILTREAVRREIWLNHGSIEAKRLMKIFGVKKKLAERKTEFNGIVRELCTIEQDAVKGAMLVLKPHWAHME